MENKNLVERVKQPACLVMACLVGTLGLTACRTPRTNVSEKKYNDWKASLSLWTFLPKKTLVASIDSPQDIKNAYITNEQGEILYTLMEEKRIPEQSKQYVRYHVCPASIGEQGDVQARISIQDPVLAEIYFLVVEDKNGKIVFNDHYEDLASPTLYTYTGYIIINKLEKEGKLKRGEDER